MAKGKETTIFFCQNCGYESSKWMGQCPGCRQWNTLVEEKVAAGSAQKAAKQIRSGERKEPTAISGISLEEEDRLSTHIGELDRVLGGGLVRGSLTLVGGDPGIGKSTLLLQVCRELAKDKREVLYISGEESLKQIKIRANRIGEFDDHLKLLCEASLDVIEDTIRRAKPQVVVIDSIQTMYCEEVSSAPGSVSQVREATGLLLKLAKGLNISIFMLDTVLYFEGDRHASYRILRGVKNRFGSTNEIGVFEMEAEGLREVKNPSEFMLSGRPQGACGSVVVCSLEGTRPMLVEIQALVCHSSFGIPRRQATGTDFNRMNLLIAILEKRLGMQLGNCDAYVNIAGGIKIQEPALDLGMVMAIASSFKNKPIPDGMVAVGEVGLSGEVRAVSMLKTRVQEAQKLGFTVCVVPKAGAESLKQTEGIQVIGVENVADAIKLL